MQFMLRHELGLKFSITVSRNIQLNIAKVTLNRLATYAVKTVAAVLTFSGVFLIPKVLSQLGL